MFTLSGCKMGERGCHKINSTTGIDQGSPKTTEVGKELFVVHVQKCSWQALNIQNLQTKEKGHVILVFVKCLQNTLFYATLLASSS